MIQEMHEEEEEDSSVGTLVEVKPSLLPAIGDTIVPVEGTIVFWQDVPTHHLTQVMHTYSSHIVSVPLIETYGDIPLALLHDQGLEQHANLEHHHITTQRNFYLIKEEMKNHPRLLLIS